MPKVTYTGYLSVTYMDYLDTDTGKVLFVEPGGTYNIQATGFNAPDVPPSEFTLVEDKEEEPHNEEEEPFSAEEDPAPEAEE